MEEPSSLRLCTHTFYYLYTPFTSPHHFILRAPPPHLSTLHFAFGDLTLRSFDTQHTEGNALGSKKRRRCIVQRWCTQNEMVWRSDWGVKVVKRVGAKESNRWPSRASNKVVGGRVWQPLAINSIFDLR